MRKLAIFVISLPLLFIALALIPMGMALDIVAAPIWISLGLIAMLRGKNPQWDIFLGPPLIGLSMYSETTGLIPNPLKHIGKRS